MPKSVMKTTVGGGCTADCCGDRGLGTRNKANHKQNIRADFAAGVDVLRIRSSLRKGYYNRGSQHLVGNPTTGESAMSNVIPEKYVDLFQKPAFASLGTLMPDGRPQVTPVWCDFDGQYVIFNSARGRQKDRNVRRDPRVALAIVDPDNPYRYMEIRGTVVEITEEGAAQHIDKMAKKYLGVDKYPYGQPGEVRVLYKIRPEHTTVMG
jgi:PPOX class probable F420-dependent enzyme